MKRQCQKKKYRFDSAFDRLAAVLLFVLLVTFLGGCSSRIKGEFGWSSVDDRGIEEPELGLLVENRYRIAREQIYFYDYESIWWIYLIDSGSYDRDEFLAALYLNNMTPDPVEVDLRHVTVQRTGFNDGFIRQKYDPLDPGNYVLKIAYKSDVIDQVEFTVEKMEGLSDYDPLRAEEFVPEDEIIRYSR